MYTDCNGNATTSYLCKMYDVTTMGTYVSEISPLLSYEIKLIFEYIIHIGLFYATSLLGITVNIINIIVYKKHGLKESITLGYFALSCSDLFVSGMPMETATCYVLKIMFPESNIDYISVHYVNASWIRDMAYSLSCSITSLLSFERCLCVILPFKVKTLFTRNRTGVIIGCIVLFHIVVYIPIFATHQLRWQPTPSRNNSDVLRVWFAPHRAVIENFNATLMSIVLPTVSQVIVTCCAAVMIHGLRKSAKFRQIATNKTAAAAGATQNFSSAVAGEQEKSSQGDSSGNEGGGVADKQNPQADKQAVLSQRDVKLVRTMVFIVAILSACNVPFLMLMYGKLAVPELNIHRAYHNTYSFIFSINYVLACLNASLNFFVYYNTSTKYRETFDQIFRRNKK